MFALNVFSRCLFAFWLTTSLSFAESTPIVAHEDPIEIDNSLTLAKVIDLTLEKFPDMAWLNSLEDQAAALAQRGKSWTAGASQASYSFQEAATGANGGKLHYINAGVQVPLWNIGQRDAEQFVGEQADTSAKTQTVATKLRVAGLVRGALWDMDLQKIRYEQAQQEIKVYKQLYEKIK